MVVYSAEPFGWLYCFTDAKYDFLPLTRQIIYPAIYRVSQKRTNSLLSLQIGFSIVRVVVACAVIGRMCYIEPSPGVPEVCYDTQLLPFYLYHNRP